jgi:uncharacterized iron-regulated protein
MKNILLIVSLFLSNVLLAQQPVAYEIYNIKGKSVKWDKMVKDLHEQDLVFFGELHNNAVAHWLQLELTYKLFDLKEGKLTLGGEMFEADNQLLIDEYFNDFIAQKNFEDEARIWPNYDTDYKPLIEFSKEKKIPFIATNVPRRYASMVNKQGVEKLEELSDEAKAWLAPLPFPFDSTLPGYEKMIKMAAHMPGKKAGAQNLAKAQALKDATMAHFIAQNLNIGFTFLHFNGSYHSDNHEGILWYIKQYAPETSIKTISTVIQDDISKIEEENIGKADYIIVVNDRVTDTYFIKPMKSMH